MNPLRPAALAVALGLVMLPARPALAASVSVSPTSGLNPSGATVSVSGSGFDAKGNNGNGVYVVFGPKAGNKDAGAFGAAKWIRPGAGMSEKGSFGTSLSIKAQYTDGHGKKVDCGKTACYIITMAAHGSSDRSQDTFTRVTFKAAKPKPKPKPTKTATPSPSPTSASPSPSKTTEKPKASPKPTESATPTATASPTPAPATSVESLTAKPAASSEKDSGTTWPYWAAAAAIVAVGGAFFLLRRRQS